MVLRESKGGLTHEQVMRMGWRQFQCYLEAFQWIGGQHSDEGRTENTRFDLLYIKDDPRLKNIKKLEVEKANAALAKMRERMKKKAALQ